MGFLAKYPGLFRGKLALDEQVTIFHVKITLLLPKHPLFPLVAFPIGFPPGAV
jgi:hypothetical protein